MDSISIIGHVPCLLLKTKKAIASSASLPNLLLQSSFKGKSTSPATDTIRTKFVKHQLKIMTIKLVCRDVFT